MQQSGVHKSALILLVVAICASAGIVAWPWLIPADVGPQTAAALPATLRTPPKTKQVSADEPRPELSALERIWQLQFYPPKPKPVAPAPVVQAAPPPPPPAPPFKARLTGTVIEGNRSMALFMTSKGTIEFKRVGESIEDAVVLSIELDEVSVKRNNETLTLHVTDQPQTRSAGTPSRPSSRTARDRRRRR